MNMCYNRHSNKHFKVTLTSNLLTTSFSIRQMCKSASSIANSVANSLDTCSLVLPKGGSSNPVVVSILAIYNRQLKRIRQNFIL